MASSSTSPSDLPPIPSSPTYSLASTARPVSSYTGYSISTMPPPPPPPPSTSVFTPSDLVASQEAYSSLLSSAKAFRLALSSLSTAASAFGASLESCARLKEARAPSLSGPSIASESCTAPTLLSAAGVQQLIANHQGILSETIYRSFEVPLLTELDKWQRDVEKEEALYARSVAAQTREIRKIEKEGARLHKQKRRDVGAFRAHLVELTGKLDGLTGLHNVHAESLLRESQQTSNAIVEASCSIVRAEVDIFESLARKGWSGGGLEDLLEKGTDLFAPDDDSLRGGLLGDGVIIGTVSGLGSTHANDAKLFSILSPMSILAEEGREVAAREGTSLFDVDEERRSFSPPMTIRRHEDVDAPAGPLEEAQKVEGKGKDVGEQTKEDSTESTETKNCVGKELGDGSTESGATTPKNVGVRDTGLLSGEHYSIWSREEEA